MNDDSKILYEYVRIFKYKKQLYHPHIAAVAEPRLH